ncbi:MFS transporter [Marinimicrobium sp. ABcell2]|uniref:MFS transporter n=1 Tax=Marinimicrobium sp. ABcell2 TaxID=3069751 RepID=UPI0027B57820|nr:MFS transporter [Marinimicrobium sp. ABcell2]MDQ2075196.1 MFS transporter [Marinimicrobium sp. ABcell2]
MHNYLRFLKSSWALLAFGFASIFWGNFGQSFFISWYGASIQASLDLSAGRYGAIYALATLASGLLIMTFGGMIDRWPLRRFVTCAALGLTAACVAMAAAVNPLLLFVGFFLVRLCGQGLLPHSAQTTMARYFDSNRGKALSISASGVPLGEVLLPTLAVALIAWLGWRGSWLVVGLSVVVLYLPLIYWLLRRSTVDTNIPPVLASAEVMRQSAGRKQMLTDYRFWLALPTVLSGPFMVTGIFIHQGFILEEKTWSASWLATCFIALGITHWVSSLTSGVLVDYFSARRLLPFTLAPLITALACLVLLEGAWSALPFMMLLGMNIGLSSPVLGALWAEVYGTAKLGSIRSLMSSLMIISTAVSPILFGVLIDRGLSVTGLFGGAGLGLLVALALVLFSYPHTKSGEA